MVDDAAPNTDGFDGLVFDFDDEGSATLSPKQPLSFQSQSTLGATGSPSELTREVKPALSNQASEHEIVSNHDEEPSVAAQSLLAGAMAASFADGTLGPGELDDYQAPAGAVGAAVFGIFDDENAAHSAVAALKNGYKQVYLCKPTHGGPRVTVRRLFGAKK